MSDTSSEVTVPCRECQAGQLHRKRVAYLTWLGDELITVPDFPAWVCDVCGRREYDLSALNQLSLLLSPTAGRPTRRRRTRPRRPGPKTVHPPRSSD